MNSVAFTAPERASDLLDLRQKFLSLYPRRDQFIWKPYSQKRWHKAVGPLLDAQILGVVSDDGRGLFRGCYWSHKTSHAVLDIDADSKYHNAAELRTLQSNLTAVGLYAISYKSSDSGGWHLYLPFDEWVESDEVNQTLKSWLKSLGYEIASGQLEIFPSGNALRLPLQKGFAWLDNLGNIKVGREEISEDEALASFLLDFEENSRNWDTAKRLMESQVQSAGSLAGAGVQEHEKVISLAGFEDFFQRGKIQETWDKGREYWLNGLTAKGQRHEAVLAIGHYLWYGDPKENVPAYPGRRNNETRARLIEAWLQKMHNGYCRHINQEQWKEIQAQIWRAVFWRRSKGYEAYSPYPLTDRLLERLLSVYKQTGKLFEIDRMAEANKTRKENARKRIAQAVSSIEADGVLLTASEVSRRSGACWRTVAKHSDLFACSDGVTNRGVWGASAPSEGLTGCNESVAVLTRIVAALEIGFEEKEKSKNPPLSLGDSLKPGLNSNGTEAYAKPISIEQATSLPSAEAPPSPPQAAASAEQPCELAPIYIAPPLLLPGEKPTSEPPASSPSPAGCFARLDAGAPVRRYSVRGSGAAGGLEPEPNYNVAEVSAPVSGDGGISLRFRTIAPVVLKLVQAMLPLLFIQSLLNSLPERPVPVVSRSHESGGAFAPVFAASKFEESGARSGVPP